MGYKRSVIAIVLIVSAIVGIQCTTFQAYNSTELSSVSRTVSSIKQSFGDQYLDEIQPIFKSRCVACHACTRAPCQLQLTSYEGARRGANIEIVHDIFRLNDAAPTRMKDAKSTEEWRQKGFFSVLPDIIDAKNSSSIMQDFINNGYSKNQPGFDLSGISAHFNDKGQVCPSNPTEYGKFVKNFPAIGMPYGLPALDEDSYAKLGRWLAGGAKGPSDEAIRKYQAISHPETVEKWEKFLNQDSAKGRLVARYIYEHMFASHIHFDNSPNNEFFEIVRSRTAYPKTIDEIVTEIPTDNPNVERFYYRFKKVTDVIIQKLHTVWSVNNEKLARLNELFFGNKWSQNQIAEVGYREKNPFVVFEQIPPEIRYRFILENAWTIVSTMVRGPSCASRSATSSIREQFWVYFIAPEKDVTIKDPSFLKLAWEPKHKIYSKTNQLESRRYLVSYKDAMMKFYPNGPTLDHIWDGNKTNPNAALTLMRHGPSVSVAYGHIGDRPETYWVVNFSNIERIYYNLVAEFFPWHSGGSVVPAWDLMKIHRQEAENRFLSFLAPEYANLIRQQWNQGIGFFERISWNRLTRNMRTSVKFDSKDPEGELVSKLESRISVKILDGNQDHNLDLEHPRNEFETEVEEIIDLEQHKFAKFMPDSIFLRLDNKHVYSLVTHKKFKYQNFASLLHFGRMPENDRMDVIRGIVVPNPQLFFDIKTSEVKSFARDLISIENQSQWDNFRQRYAVRRNDARFWPLYDWFTAWNYEHDPLGAGVLDLLNYDMPEAVE